MINLIDILPFLQRYPRPIKLLVVGWVANAAIFIIGFIFTPHRHGQTDYLQLFQSKPLWLQIWFVVCLMHMAAVLISLLLSRPALSKEQAIPESQPEKRAKLNTAPIPNPQPALSLEDIVRQKLAVSGRFAEEEKLRKKLHGIRVWCVCTVDSVSGNVSLIAKAWIDPGNRVHESHTLFISYPGSFATQAFAFRRGDQIRIAGALDMTHDYGRDFKIEGEQLEFVRAVDQK